MFVKLHQLNRYQNEGLLLLRLGLGLMFLYYGTPKLLGGVAGWEKLGSTMQLLGISFAPAFWGFMSACAEFFGGMLILLGFLTRPACSLLIVNLIVAIIMHLSGHGGFTAATHAVDLEIIFISLMLIGPGKYSLDEKLWGEAVAQRNLAHSA